MVGTGAPEPIQTTTSAPPGWLQLREDVESEPLPDKVYELIRDAICSGHFAPKKRLVQELIAEELGVSRTPVREALSRLAADGYVRRVPGGGHIVGNLSDADVADLYQIRRSLEPLAVQLAFSHYRPRDVNVLRASCGELNGPEWASSGYHQLNRRFHLALIEPCPNRMLVDMIKDLWDRPVMRMMTHNYVKGFRDPAAWRDEHQAIVIAIEDDDLDLTLLLLKEHLAHHPSEG
jgi:DNA-binding GntR family transcriptional regulator